MYELVISVITIFILFLICSYLDSTSKPMIVKKLNHLNNTERYEIENDKGTPINPYIVVDKNCFYFYVSFTLKKSGHAIGLAMVKINIDGKELAIRLYNSVSSTLATKNTVGNSIGNTFLVSSNTSYTTFEGDSVALNKEQYLFLSKLPICKAAVIHFIGITGDIEQTIFITNHPKKCMGYMIEQSKALMKQGKKIKFYDDEKI